MTKIVSTGTFLAALIAGGIAFAPLAARADDMKKDTMGHSDSMSKDQMKKDSMAKDTMTKDSMSKDHMTKDSMSNDTMKK